MIKFKTFNSNISIDTIHIETTRINRERELMPVAIGVSPYNYTHICHEGYSCRTGEPTYRQACGVTLYPDLGIKDNQLAFVYGAQQPQIVLVTE